MGLLDDWIHSREMKKVAQNNELQLATFTGQQTSMQVRKEITLQELEIANKVADLRHKISLNDANVQNLFVQIEKEKDGLEQSKAKFRLYLDQQRQEMEIQLEKFRNEQENESKKLNNDFMIRMGELQLKKLESEQNHVLEMSKLEIELEKRQHERAIIEEAKTEKLLASLKEDNNQAGEQRHIEKMKGLEIKAREFELELAAVRLLDDASQAVEFSRIRKNIQEKMSGFGNSTKGSIYGEYD